ncbi:MAG: hypothetical protein JXB47_11555 [Anaerolineae bacterium]|nr:hypothetical protein [Anaerolineae bacterium]
MRESIIIFSAFLIVGGISIIIQKKVVFGTGLAISKPSLTGVPAIIFGVFMLIGGSVIVIRSINKYWKYETTWNYGESIALGIVIIIIGLMVSVVVKFAQIIWRD